MPAVVLSRNGRALRHYAVSSGEWIGRSHRCRVVVPDPDVCDHAYRVEFAEGELQLVDPQGRKHPLRVGEGIDIGAYRVEWRQAEETPVTAVARPAPLRSERYTLRAKGRRQSLREGALVVGSSAAAHFRLEDRTVSGQHCSFEPCSGGVVVRDLGSLNGTWVDGQRVLGALEVQGRRHIRVGRTQLQLQPKDDAPDFVAASKVMRALLEDVQRFARLPYPVLILGESGAGKEGVARRLHEESPRALGPFVTLNAGALSPELINSELFGHVRGAYTGASARRDGVFQRAQGGTLFLDEIGELPLVQQTRLLRVLEEWKVRPVGSDREYDVDVRLVCATNRDPLALVRDGRLRRDLYHRIGRLLLNVPPLRQRGEDIEPLVRLFLSKHAAFGGHRELDADVLPILRAQRFDGNVRELRNLVERCAALSDARIDVELVRRVLGEDEQADLQDVLASYGGNVSAAARAAGMPRSTFRDRIRKLEEEELAESGYRRVG
ncbi:MAG: sigma 54-interacting transcriptional regulator [Myxococcota bacterium]